MKDLFPGYSKKSDKEIKNIWDTCIIVFDTNTLLNLYRYSDSTRTTILQLIARFADRIWLPHQAALEFNKNKYEVIANQEKAYKDFIEKITQIQKDLQSTSKPPFLSTNVHNDFDDVFEKVNLEVDESIRKYATYLKEDPIYGKISDLFNGKVGEPFSIDQLEEIYKQGEERYKLKIPPGYEDEKNKEGSRMYGDLVLWKQVINKAKSEKKPIILVTDERKADWWWKIKDGRTMGPRQELVEELKKESDMEFHMYSSERFLSYGQSYLEEKVSQKAVEELQAIKKAELQILQRSQLIEEREKQRDLIALDELSYMQQRLSELNAMIYRIEVQCNDLQQDAFKNSEAQEYFRNLNIQKDELQEEIANMRKEIEQHIRQSLIRQRDKRV